MDAYEKFVRYIDFFENLKKDCFYPLKNILDKEIEERKITFKESLEKKKKRERKSQIQNGPKDKNPFKSNQALQSGENPESKQPRKLFLKPRPINVGFREKLNKIISIYVDESWPHEEIAGILAGIVWLGEKPDPQVLPIPPQHTRGTDNMRHYLERLDACDRAIPFFVEFEPPPEISRGLAYEQMVHETLLVVLGWLLPEKLELKAGETVGVNVVCEAIAGYEHGTDHTREFQGILTQAARRNPSLFQRWRIQKFQWVQKIGGLPNKFSDSQIEEQGYLAYGDLLAYLAFRNTNDNAAAVARRIGFDSFPNRMRISPGLLSTLEFLQSHQTFRPDVFLDQMAPNQHLPFLQAFFDNVRQALAQDKKARLSLLEELDRRYQEKVRDLHALSRQFSLVQRVVGELSEDAPRRLRLLDLGIRLQHANHFGDPEKLGNLEANYAQLREIALENGDADLVAHVDLNLAVRAADRFEPEEALSIVEELLEEEHRLSLLFRGRAHSARGQYLSMMEDHEEARREFERAISLFERADLSPGERLGELDQTGIYRAFAAIDAEDPDAETLVAALMRPGEPNLSLENQFRHHLYVRWLDSLDEYAEKRRAYMENVTREILPDTHPWQLIAMYRGLFALEQEKDEDAIFWLRQAIDIASQGAGGSHGATLRMMAAVIATLAWVTTEEEEFHRRALVLLDGEAPNPVRLEDVLPVVREKTGFLREVLERYPPADSLDDVLSVLTFNYR